MEYKHINDCWNAIRDCKTIYEVYKTIDQFPRWSGDWDVQVEDNSYFEKNYVVYNTYWDENLEGQYTDAETLDIAVEEGEEA